MLIYSVISDCVFFQFFISIAILIALSFGIMLSPNDWTKSFVWWLVGSAGAAMLYRLPTHWSFVGGIILAIYLMSIWPLMADKLARCNPGLTLPIAMGLYIVLILASVWVVAFNFVPGGEFTRERTGTLMAITMLLIGELNIGVYCCCSFFLLVLSFSQIFSDCTLES